MMFLCSCMASRTLKIEILPMIICLQNQCWSLCCIIMNDARDDVAQVRDEIEEIHQYRTERENDRTLFSNVNVSRRIVHNIGETRKRNLDRNREKSKTRT